MRRDFTYKLLKSVGLLACGICMNAWAVPAVGASSDPIENGSPRLEHFAQRVREKDSAYRKSGPIVVVAFGDSITMGATTGGHFIPEEVYHKRLQKLLTKRLPGPSGATMSFINAGIGSDKTQDGLERIERDVLRYQPDLVIVAFGTNDFGLSVEHSVRFEENLRRIVKRIQAETSADIILLTPPFVASEDIGIVSGAGMNHLKSLMRVQNEGIVKRYADIVHRVAVEYSLPVADVYAAWEAREKTEGDMTRHLANGLNHPTADMHEIPAALIFDIIERSIATGAQ